MCLPPHTQEFESAISIVPLTSNTYSANLSAEWSIGSVPNGGYLTALLHHTSTAHLNRTHPSLHSSTPWPISMQLCFLRKASTGRATLVVQDTKLGRRTSTLHITLTQGDITKVVSYVTVSDPTAEKGISTPSIWALHPPPPSARLPELGGDTPGNLWVKSVVKHPNYRRAACHTEAFIASAKNMAGIVEQWVRFRPIGPEGGDGRWTNQALAYLMDIFPATLASLEVAANDHLQTLLSPAERQNIDSVPVPFWFPTVTQNIDFKKCLPEEGVAWLYSRVTTKAVRNGRTDVEVVILDEEGELVALGNQVALIMGAERNREDRPKM